MSTHNLWITYDESSTGGESEGGGEWSSRADEFIEFHVTGAFTTERDGMRTETVEVNFDPAPLAFVYVLVVRYRSGNTFGSTYGNGHIEGAYESAAQVEAVGKAIRNGSHEKGSYDSYRALKGIGDGYLHIPWEGYFERLEGIEAIPVRLNEPTRIDL